MFKPARMKKIKLLLPVEQEDSFLKEVGKLGILQVATVEKKPPSFRHLSTGECSRIII